jgi:hypothetical protein
MSGKKGIKTKLAALVDGVSKLLVNIFLEIVHEIILDRFCQRFSGGAWR